MIRAFVLSCLIVVGAFGCSVSGATPEQLLALVPDDYSFCLVGHKAASELTSPAESNFGRAFWQSSMLKELEATPDIARLLTAKGQLVRELGTTEKELLDLVFGGTILLTYRKPAEGKPETEAGMLILTSENTKGLRETVNRINQLQVRGGELRAVEAVKGPTTYQKRIKADPAAPPEYFWMDGGTLIFTSNETLLRETLTRRDAPPVTSTAVNHFKSLALAGTPVSLLVNPRSFDREVDAVVSSGKPGERAVLDLFGKTWKAIDQLALHLSRKPDVTFGVTIGCDTSRLPLAAKTLIAGFNKPLRSWDRLPENALLAVVLPFRPASFDDLLKSVVPEGDHRKLREAVLTAVRPLGEEIEWDELMRMFGPEIAFWVSPPDPKKTGEDPSVAVALPLEQDRANTSGKLVTDGLDFLVRLLCLTDGSYRVTTVKAEKGAIKKLSHPSFPTGVEPCYSIRDGVLLVASHPRMIDQFQQAARDPKTREVNPVLRMSGPAWSEYLNNATSRIASKMSADPKEQERLSGVFKSLAPVLRELNRVELNVTTDKNLARLRLQLIEQPVRAGK